MLPFKSGIILIADLKLIIFIKPVCRRRRPQSLSSSGNAGHHIHHQAASSAAASPSSKFSIGKGFGLVSDVFVTLSP